MAPRVSMYLAIGLISGLAVGFLGAYIWYQPQIEESERRHSELADEIGALEELLEESRKASGPEVLKPHGNVKVINMTAAQFDFRPDKITVNLGDIVVLRIKSVSELEPQYTEHGILIQGYGIDEVLPKDKIVTIIFPAEKAGTFFFRCSVNCGSGHVDMLGQLIVEG